MHTHPSRQQNFVEKFNNPRSNLDNPKKKRIVKNPSEKKEKTYHRCDPDINHSDHIRHIATHAAEREIRPFGRERLSASEQ